MLRWNNGAARYVDESGRFVPVAAVRAAGDAAILEGNKVAADLAQRLIDGKISAAQFEQLLRDEALKSHLAHAMAGKGGKAHLNQADYGRVGQIWRQELGYLRERVRKIVDGTQPLDGRLKQIAQLYIEAGRTTFHIFDDIEARIRGFDEEHNVLSSSEHCDGCLDEERKGWVPSGTLAQPGDRFPCRRRCRCGKKQRNTLTGEVRE